MDYKRIFSPMSEEKNLAVDCEIIEKKINEIKSESNFELPESYIEMLKACDGGSLHRVYVPCKKKFGEISYSHLNIVYGVARNFWSIQRAYKQNWELILDNGFDEFVVDFLGFAYDTGQVEKFKEEGALPYYFESENPDEELIIHFYNDFALYIDKLDAIISKLQYSDNNSINAQIVFQYNMSKFFRQSLEFASDDGHENFHLFYGDKNSSQPSVWYVHELDYQYKVASDFKEFIKILVIERNEVCFGISEINNEISSFINKLLVSIFNTGDVVTIDDINERVLENNEEYSITLDGEIRISIRPNKYSDGSGFNEWIYRDYIYILKIGSSSYNGNNEQIVFKKDYEEKILNVFKGNRFESLKLLYTIGMNNLSEEIAKADTK